MFRFIRRHWIAYLIAAVIAAAMGTGAAYVIGVRYSTPEDVRAARVAAEKSDSSLADEEDAGSGSSQTGSASEGDPVG